MPPEEPDDELELLDELELDELLEDELELLDELELEELLDDELEEELALSDTGRLDTKHALRVRGIGSPSE